MKKIDKHILKFYFLALPIAIIMMVWDSKWDADSVRMQSEVVQYIYNASAFVFLLWILFSLYISARLLFSKAYRNEALSKLCYLKDSDEREEHISGQATKNSLLITLAVLITLFCLSAFQFGLYHRPPEKAINGQTGMLVMNFGIGFSAENPPIEGKETVDESKPHFIYNGLPLSKSVILLILICTQIVAYNYSYRKLQKA